MTISPKFFIVVMVICAILLVAIYRKRKKPEPKDDFEEYAKKIIDRAYFIILNKIDELDGTNERLLEEYREYVEKTVNL